MSDEPGQAEFWEQKWEQALSQHGDAVRRMPPNAHLLAEVGDLAPGRALDAGSGHGAETIWLAGKGWQVQAVDFSVTALEHARTTAASLGSDIADRIEWVEGDLSTWMPEQEAFDLVSCLYVHVAGDVAEMVSRLGQGVAPGGTLLMVGHQPIDPATGDRTAAWGQVQLSVADAREALDENEWEIVVAEERGRAGGGGVDAVIRAVRRDS
ncbi:MAG TPA: class I SAM-dependent methyltransferase [Nocardioidaceae bacterium]|nr:class I SAM-dependent methyltransferase [Nocardioidaceae bacterium]